MTGTPGGAQNWVSKSSDGVAEGLIQMGLENLHTCKSPDPKIIILKDNIKSEYHTLLADRKQN